MHGRKYGLQYENKNGAEFRLETRYEGIEMAEAWHKNPCYDIFPWSLWACKLKEISGLYTTEFKSVFNVFIFLEWTSIYSWWSQNGGSWSDENQPSIFHISYSSQAEWDGLEIFTVHLS